MVYQAKKPFNHLSTTTLFLEFSLFMLVNKLRNADEFKELKKIPPDYLKNLQENSPQQSLETLSMAISTFMRRLNIPKECITMQTDSTLLSEWFRLALKSSTLSEFEEKIK